MNISKVKALTAAVCMALSGAASATALTVDGGWTADTIFGAGVDSGSSPWTFIFGSGGGLFSITDQFIVGDQYSVFIDGGGALLTALDGAQTSILPIGDALGDAGWTSAAYQHGQWSLGAGSHSVVIQGDGVGGLPAGFYIRADTAPVPEPETYAMLLAGLGLLGFVARRRKQKLAAA